MSSYGCLYMDLVDEALTAKCMQLLGPNSHLWPIRYSLDM